jgi:Heterokaryon incompatibility protein (HET)
VHISTRTINCDPKCHVTYERVRQWLQQCDEQHQGCQSVAPTSKRWPTFLLDVNVKNGKADVIRLVTPEKSEYVHYAALSYCWGGPQKSATTKATYQAHQEGIDLESLPQTLQDAVFVTRRLGISHLWIDSLCIIQDSNHDRTQEIAKMEHIYTNAHVTISAACAQSCNDGFLHRRQLQTKPIDVPFTCTNGEIGNISLIPHNASKYSLKQLDYIPKKQPVDHRAWTFQETFLSRRVLLFSDRQSFWFCGETWDKDGGRAQRKEFPTHNMSSWAMKSPDHSDWLKVIEQYAPRKLTDPHDKLPALSSIAAYFARALGDKYIAGLWVKDILHQISWVRAAANTGRPPVWRAPSWSFMSVDGGISFKAKDDVKFKASDCTIMDYHVRSISTEAQFGRISWATVRVSGRLKECKPVWANWYPEGPADHYTGYRVQSIEMDSKGRRIDHGQLRYDFTTPQSRKPYSRDAPAEVLTNYGPRYPTDPVWCLFLCTERHMVHPDSSSGGPDGGPPQSYEVWRPWGLALAKRPDGRFHRVGTFLGTTSMTRKFYRLAPVIITII